MSEIDWSKAPEGATHARDCGWDHPDWYKIVDGVLMVHSCNEGWDESGYSDMGAVPNLQTRPAKAWNGTGLPPVGESCEYFDGGEWMRCEVVAHRNNAAVVLSDCYEAAFVVARELRPIRTQAQIEAEEREKAVSDMLSMWMDCGSARDFCEYLHDHGYRKQGEAK